MKTTAMTKTRTKAAAHTAAQAEISGKVIATMAAPAALIGLWSVACLVSAVIQSGGPLALVTAWFQAVAGI